MPRVNLDDDFFGRDKRFEKLARLSGEHYLLARSRLLDVWYWCHCRRSVNLTREEIDTQAQWDRTDVSFAELLVEARLATQERPSKSPASDPANPVAGVKLGVAGVYRIRGVEERIKYLVEYDASRAVGGKARVAGAPRDERGRLLPRNHSLDAKQHPASSSSSASFSASVSASFSEESSKNARDDFVATGPSGLDRDADLEAAFGPTQEPEVLPPEDVPAKKARKKKAGKEGVTTPTWRAYVEAYGKRYRDERDRPIEPRRDPTISGQLVTFITRVGEEDAPAIARFYVQHNARFYVQQSHSFGLAAKDAHKLRTEWLSGRRVTASEATQIDKMQATFDAADRGWGKWDEKVEGEKNV